MSAAPPNAALPDAALPDPAPPVPAVVALGEALLRLSPPGSGRIRAARSLEVHVGGSEANVAAGCASLGLPSRWLSRVSDDAPGDLILDELARHRVDVSLVSRRPGRSGLYWLERGIGCRAGRVIYDRAHSAFGELTPDELPERAFRGARVFHTSGICFSLPRTPAEALAHAWQRAGAHGLLRSLDVNLRTTLIAPAELLQRLRPLLRDADLVFVAERDAAAMGLGSVETDGRPPAALRRACPRATLVITRGAQGVLAAAPEGEPLATAAIPSDGPGRIGRGDALVAGFLAGLLAPPPPRTDGGLGDRPDHPLASAAAMGVAAAALKTTQAGDLPLLERAQVEALAGGGAPGGLRR